MSCQDDVQRELDGKVFVSVAGMRGGGGWGSLISRQEVGILKQ